MKKLVTIHHYLGTLFFMLFLVWFLSGFVMMYKSFPFLGKEEKIHRKKETSLTTEKILPPVAVFEKDTIKTIHKLRINSILNNIVYHVETASGKLISRYAKDGKLINLTKNKALGIAKNATNLKYIAEVTIINEVDQWIPRPKFIKHLPVYKVKFTNRENTWVHVSSLTGEILNITTSHDRFWAWVGAIPHWLYFKDIRIHSYFWQQLILWLAALGLLMTLTGIVTGLIRYKKKPKANFKRFKNKWYNLHYYFGLGFGLFICTWVFSGFMSMTPFNWVPSSSLNQQDKSIWQGQNFTLKSITDKDWTNFKELASKSKFKEIHFSLFNDNIFIEKFNQNTIENHCITNSDYNASNEQYIAKINSFNTKEKVTELVVLNDYDTYYYDRKNIKTLPVIKIITNKSNYYYINPKTNTVLLKSAPKNRTERWLYHGLHSLDFSFLSKNRPLWDIVMIFLLTGGTITCITATGLGIKFIKRKTRKHLKNK
nr:PepSY domain-containing protein [Tenacibaculum ovolyticum]